MANSKIYYYISKNKSGLTSAGVKRGLFMMPLLPGTLPAIFDELLFAIIKKKGELNIKFYVL